MSGHDLADKPRKTTHELVPVPGSALRWTYWPNVPLRTDRVARPVADRRGPRASRWGDLR